MAILMGGAMRVTDAKSKSAEMAQDCIGFLDLFWHGGHPSMGGTGIDIDVDAYLPVAEDTPSGQFEFYFCSTGCLREFLNGCVNDFAGGEDRESAHQAFSVGSRLGESSTRAKGLQEVGGQVEAGDQREGAEHRLGRPGWPGQSP